MCNIRGAGVVPVGTHFFPLHTVANLTPSYVLSVLFSDNTNHAWFMVNDAAAERLMGLTADEFMEVKVHSEAYM